MKGKESGGWQLDSVVGGGHGSVVHRIPLYRSLLFWAGVMVLLTLWAACLDSTRAYAELSYKEAYLANQGCGLNVSRRQFVGGTGWTWKRTELPEAGAPGLQWRGPMLLRIDAAGHSNAKDYATWQERLTLSWMFASGPGDWHLYLPYWLLIAVLGPVWLVAMLGLAWWRRRGANAAAAAVEEEGKAA